MIRPDGSEYLHNGSAVVHLQTIGLRKQNGIDRLVLFGITPSNQSISVVINDFHPSLLLKVPTEWGEDADDIEEEIESITDGLQNDTRIINPVVNWKLETHSPFMGFTNNRQDKFIRLDFSDVSTMKKCATKLFRYKTYHSSWKYDIQFLQQKNMMYQDWLIVDQFEENDRFRTTNCQFEIRCKMNAISKYEKKDVPLAPRMLTATVRTTAISRDGIVLKKYAYHPNPELPADRIVAITVLFTWVGEKTPCKEVCITWLPDVVSPNTKIDMRKVETEEELLETFKTLIVSEDPDDFVMFPDYLNDIAYIYDRCKTLNVDENLKFDRFRGLKISPRKGKGGDIMGINTSRTVLDLVGMLKRKVFLSYETLDLDVISCHSAMRRMPENPTRFIERTLESTNEWMVSDRQKLIDWNVFEAHLVNGICIDMGTRLEFANASATTYTPITSTCGGGVQELVFNALATECRAQKQYINKEMTGRKPLRFSFDQRKPTFIDPDELPLNFNLRKKKYAELVKKLHLYDWAEKDKCVESVLKVCRKQLKKTLNDNEEDELLFNENADEEEQKLGGNVVQPTPDMFSDIGVEDFAALYPTIMMRNRLGYRTIVYEERYLDLPGIEYINVPINGFEVVVYAQMEKATMPDMLKRLLASRRVVKKQMFEETDPFLKQVLNFRQNSIKIICNGTYGFTGVVKGGMLPLKEVMLSVTSYGRYYQTFTTQYYGIKYNISVIYGDTDSVFIDLHVDKTKSIDEIIDHCRERFEMDGYVDDKPFTRENIFEWWQNKKKKPLDFEKEPKEIQFRCILYLIFMKLGDEMTEIFGRPIELEFENMCSYVWMSWIKKHYMYLMLDENDPRKVKKLKVTGMASKKRDWCPWLRRLLRKVSLHIINKRREKIKPEIEDALDKLVNGEVQFYDTRISKIFKGWSEYKSYNSINCQVVMQYEEKMRWPISDKTRIFMTVKRCNNKKLKLYEKSTIPSKTAKIDLEWYMDNQFFKPMLKLLAFHQEDVDMMAILNTYKEKLNLKETGRSSLASMFGFSEKKIVSKRVKRDSNEVNKLLKNVVANKKSKKVKSTQQSKIEFSKGLGSMFGLSSRSN
jgi:DNA polymerase elongation subunit (family B)